MCAFISFPCPLPPWPSSLAGRGTLQSKSSFASFSWHGNQITDFLFTVYQVHPISFWTKCSSCPRGWLGLDCTPCLCLHPYWPDAPSSWITCHSLNPSQSCGSGFLPLPEALIRFDLLRPGLQASLAVMFFLLPPPPRCWRQALRWPTSPCFYFSSSSLNLNLCICSNW